MPPLSQRDFDLAEPSRMLGLQWAGPGDVFSVLLLLGGDVINRALAQITGSRISPVAFSFGWVAYAVTAVTSAVGENRLMPPADTACKLINASNAYVHDNQSWILGRIVRDFESWTDKRVLARTEELIEEQRKSNKATTRRDQAGLCIAFYRATGSNPDYSGYDRVFVSGFVVIAIQLGVASIPCALFGDWSVLLITSAGTLLSLATASLRQWSREKWGCHRPSKDTYVLTRGQGSQYAIVIESAGKGFGLEILSGGSGHVSTFTGWFTRVFLVTMAALWVMLLITASGITRHTWYLLAVGGIGMFQNLYVAGATRSPEAFGLPLEYQGVVGHYKVMKALEAVEDSHPGCGLSMLKTFFPGDLRPEEDQFWSDRKSTLSARKEAKKLEERQMPSASLLKSLEAKSSRPRLIPRLGRAVSTLFRRTGPV